ncbi:MAG: hypothetical protein KKF65_00395, partial [Nanoarchaeota archaeon]|nr:hypothetical protein [Nanoarchaeota archaeon]
NITLNILDVNISKVELGKIIPIDILIESNWNIPLDCEIEIDVFSQKGLVETLKGPSVSVNKQESTSIFWDTTTLEKGDYLMVIKVIYKNQIKSEKEVYTTLSEEGTTIKEKITVSLKIKILSIIIVTLAGVIAFLEKQKSKKREKFK